MLTGRKSYGDASSLDEAKAAFKAEYERWLKERGSSIPRQRHRRVLYAPIYKGDGWWFACRR
jgi:hypothetical protein